MKLNLETGTVVASAKVFTISCALFGGFIGSGRLPVGDMYENLLVDGAFIATGLITEVMMRESEKTRKK